MPLPSPERRQKEESAMSKGTRIAYFYFSRFTVHGR